MSQQSEACCTIPPVIIENYTTKGRYVELAGMKAYVTGPSDAKGAILFFHDIFGYTPQSLEGADILSSIGKDGGYLVIIPDFFDGEPADASNYPPQDEEGKAKMQKFWQRIAPAKQLPKVPSILEAAEKEFSSIEKWATIGYCWGGKMVSLLLGTSDKFTVAIQSSPASVDPADAEKIKTPIFSMASKGEDPEIMKQYHAALKWPNKYEHWSDQLHGWMSGRSNWHDPKVKVEYERGYQMAGDWFNKYM